MFSVSAQKKKEKINVTRMNPALVQIPLAADKSLQRLPFDQIIAAAPNEKRWSFNFFLCNI